MQLLLFDLNHSQLMLAIGKFESVSRFEYVISLFFCFHVQMIAINYCCLRNPLLSSMSLSKWDI